MKMGCSCWCSTQSGLEVHSAFPGDRGISVIVTFTTPTLSADLIFQGGLSELIWIHIFFCQIPKTNVEPEDAYLEL